MADASILSVKGVETFYGAIQALHGVDLEVARGEIVTLIGANGAGKSTLLMTICGNPRARGGRIRSTARTSRPCRPFRSCGAAWRRCRRGGASSRA